MRVHRNLLQKLAPTITDGKLENPEGWWGDSALAPRPGMGWRSPGPPGGPGASKASLPLSTSLLCEALSAPRVRGPQAYGAPFRRGLAPGSHRTPETASHQLVQQPRT